MIGCAAHRLIKLQIFEGRQYGFDAGLMADKQQILLVTRTIAQRAAPAPAHLAAVRPRRAGENAQQTGFARAVRPFYLNDIARLN